jgi:hypothetical protein
LSGEEDRAEHAALGLEVVRGDGRDRGHGRTIAPAPGAVNEAAESWKSRRQPLGNARLAVHLEERVARSV